ncbi:hypothetical protein BATDEDRAFT_9677 [Lichtheimia corymbifera JMRC:FSU:9682]|uniref:Uncharacterized protein n=1 Tax=Lichtheimia corymbifera JMRC:FSU:9682 TaxID=1263082 RepID=A0A068SDV7_9FUNG|nr:hypothetical protein BATDEDRAFT_9677 [Lichtheimia corymbifera JMRC:FSU:9682]
MMFIIDNSSAPSCPSTVDGDHYIRWIHTLFGDCVYGWQDSCSVLLGYLSILCWLNAQLPQIIKNYQLQDASSLSFTFLMTWLIADVANFIGCILTGQLDFQLYLAIYFTLVDAMLCIQWVYYVRYPRNGLRLWLNNNNQHHITSCSQEQDPLLNTGGQDKTDSSAANYGNNSNNTEGGNYQAISSQEDIGGSSSSGSNSKRGADAVRALFMVGYLVSLRGVSPADAQSSFTTIPSHDLVFSSWDTDLWIGRFFGWLCALLYLSSRVPQMYRNFRRRSAQGLSMALFLCAAAGNLTYTLGILLNPNQNRQTMLEAIPYILGSAGTLVFDVTIYIQHAVYSRHTEEKTYPQHPQHHHPYDEE